MFMAENPEARGQVVPNSQDQYGFRDPAYPSGQRSPMNGRNGGMGIPNQLGRVMADFNDRDGAYNYAAGARSAQKPLLPRVGTQLKNANTQKYGLEQGLRFENPLVNAGAQTLKPRKIVERERQNIHKPVDRSSIVGNPILGGSEGEKYVGRNKKMYYNYAQSQLEGSMDDVKSRSRSKSKRAKLEAQIADDQHFKQEGMEFLAQKQNQYAAYDFNLHRHKLGTIHATLHRSDSQEAMNPPPPQYQDMSNQRHASAVQDYMQQYRRPTSIMDPPERSPMRRVRAISAEKDNEEVFTDKKQKQSEYKDYLMQQMEDQKQKKQDAKFHRIEEDDKYMAEFNQFYKYGRNVGGGSPQRDKQGIIVAQHSPFAAQMQRNGGMEELPNPAAQHHFRQQPPQLVMDVENIPAVLQTGSATGTYSPSRQEQIHMKPSNFFQDITEDEFNQKEAEKNDYKNQLLRQMNEQKAKKAEAKQTRLVEEMEQEQKVRDQLDQLKAEFMNEENPKPQYQPQISPPDSPDTKSRISNRSPKQQIQQNFQPDYGDYGNQQQIPLSHLEPLIATAIANQRPAIAPSDYSSNDQMDRLRRMQEEIDRKNAQDRVETQNMIQSIVDQSKNFSLRLRPQLIHEQEIMGQGFKHESRFEKFQQYEVPANQYSLTENQQSAFQSHDEIKKLDVLIDGFEQVQ